MTKCTVIGSGPSGVHYALTALQRGYQVDMIDVGYREPTAINPNDSFSELKSTLEDPAAYLLGENNEGVLLPGTKEEFYGIPPSKSYALRLPSRHHATTRRFEPMYSFARGGLAQVWTAGCYPFNEAELADYLFEYEDMLRCYETVAARIGISGLTDDLATLVPWHENIQQALPLDAHSSALLSRYQQHKQLLQDRYGCYLGRARHAVLSRDLDERKACQQLGRCLWGCPNESIYTPSVTLKECMKHPGFTYHGDHYVRYFDYDDSGRVQAVVAETASDNRPVRFDVDILVLAAGTLGTSKIYLESIYRKTGEIRTLPGLMDNRQVLVPFLNLAMIGQPCQAKSYQYNQLAMELGSDLAHENVHCLITTLKTAMIHPVIEKFPLDLKTSIQLFKNIHTALGVLNVNFHDTRREDCYVTLDVSGDERNPALSLHYSPLESESRRIAYFILRVKKILWKLGCIVPPGMVYTRPMGASVHYAGTLPMSVEKRTASVSPECRSHDFENLYIADGASYPFLPAKNITFTLMANAVRVAELMG